VRRIREATKEEIESIKANSHFTPDTGVYAMDGSKGGPHLAVVRMILAMDPVFFAKDTNTVERSKFVQLMEAVMFGAGLPQYYFNVEASDEHWQKVVESWGAIKVSGVPEFQYKRNLR
jgi:hypothetical protein